jgi:hypothetical protein
MRWNLIDNMPKRDISDRYLPAGQAYDLLCYLFQYNNPLITTQHSYPATDSEIIPTKVGGIKNLAESKIERFFETPP